MPRKPTSIFDKNRSKFIYKAKTNLGFSFKRVILGLTIGVSLLTNTAYSDELLDDCIKMGYGKSVCKDAINGDLNVIQDIITFYDEINDYNKSFMWNKYATKFGSLTAQLKIGDSYYWGRGVQQNYNQAFEWYEIAAKKDSSEAKFKIGTMYEYGHGVLKDPEKAYVWYLSSAKDNNMYSQYKVAAFNRYGYVGKKNYELAIEWFKKSAKNGLPLAMYELGKSYEFGYGVVVDYKEAHYWYKLAADKGLPEAQNNLGSLYERGLGAEKSEKKAFELYSKAASSNYYLALYNVGRFYEDGIGGVYRNYETAASYYTKSAYYGYSKAEQALGVMYIVGAGLPKDNIKAYAWLTVSATCDATGKSIENIVAITENISEDEIKQAKKLASEYLTKFDCINVDN